MHPVRKLAVLAIVTAIVVSGCLQYETLISVNRDGSGSLTQTFLMNREVLAMLEGMSTESSKNGEEFSLLDVEELEDQAEAMGPGVRFVSAEPVETDWGEGYVAVFDFDDISALRVNQNPGEKMPETGGPVEETNEENLTFEFAGGVPATLTVRFPAENEDETPGEPAGESMDTEGMEEMMRQFYAGMRIMIAVEVDGRVVSTNATYQDGNRVTLLDLNFDAILKDPDASQRLMKNQAESVSDLQALADTVPGVKIETTDPVQIRFR